MKISDPLEANYKKLKTELVPVAKQSEEFKIIEKYIKNTQDTSNYSIVLENVFTVSREVTLDFFKNDSVQGEKERFEKHSSKLGNHQLLIHGSRLTNFVGILSQGMKF